MKSAFPSQIPKTEQERCQNLVKEISKASEIGANFEITEKLEGSSMTCYLIDGIFGVCSRNLLDFADGNSVMIGKTINAPLREGLVFKEINGSMSFKVISDRYLLSKKVIQHK